MAEENTNNTELSEETESTDLEALTPHSYPLWIKCFGGIVLCLSVYSLLPLPTYFSAAKELQHGENAFARKEYQAAIKHFEDALLIVPSSKTAKIALAKTYFATKSKENYAIALHCLQGITLKGNSLKEIKAVLPEGYRNYFQPTKG